MEYIITFKSTNFAIKAEKCLLEDKIFAGVLPLPPQISAGCGICLRVKEEELPRALTVLTNNGIEGIGLYKKEEIKGRAAHTLIEK